MIKILVHKPLTPYEREDEERYRELEKRAKKKAKK